VHAEEPCGPQEYWTTPTVLLETPPWLLPGPPRGQTAQEVRGSGWLKLLKRTSNTCRAPHRDRQCCQEKRSVLHFSSLRRGILMRVTGRAREYPWTKHINLLIASASQWHTVKGERGTQVPVQNNSLLSIYTERNGTNLKGVAQHNVTCSICWRRGRRSAITIDFLQILIVQSSWTYYENKGDSFLRYHALHVTLSRYSRTEPTLRPTLSRSASASEE